MLKIGDSRNCFRSYRLLVDPIELKIGKIDISVTSYPKMYISGRYLEIKKLKKIDEELTLVLPQFLNFKISTRKIHFWIAGNANINRTNF